MLFLLPPLEQDKVFTGFCFGTWRLTVCVTRVWAGVDNVWEQEKLEARKMPVNRAESHTSGARFVRQPARLPERLLKKDTAANTPNFYTQPHL